MLDKGILSNASLQSTLKIVFFMCKSKKEVDLKDLKIIGGDSDPHHQVNNGIRLGLIEKQNTTIFLTQEGKDFCKLDNEKQSEWIKNNLDRIKILKYACDSLKMNNKIKIKDIGKIIEQTKNVEYSEKSLNALINTTINWLTESKYAYKKNNYIFLKDV